eukprot:Rmarinus@m.21213
MASVKLKSFMKRSRKGSVMKVIREHYLRDDVYCGSPLCPVCRNPSNKSSFDRKVTEYLVPDTNVILNQIDLLENPAIKDVLLLQTVLEETRNRSVATYNRARKIAADPTRRWFVFSNEHHRLTYIERQPGESVNDRNDRAIRVAAAWYNRHLSNAGVKTRVLTNDRACLEKAKAEGLTAQTIHDYVKQAYPELQDYLAAAQPTEADGSGAGAEQVRGKRRVQHYQTHLPMSEVNAGLKDGSLVQGVFRVNPTNILEASVTREGDMSDVLIQSWPAQNRAVDGDVVAVKLFPKEQWQAPMAEIIERGEGGEEEDDVLNGTAPPPRPAETAEKGAKVLAAPRPTGTVVGIIKRNWRPYCGTLRLKGMEVQDNQTSSVLFLPIDRRIPKIRIQTRQGEALKDKRIVVVIDSWSLTSRYPDGHYVRTIGSVGDKEAETEVLLLENDVPVRPFSAAVLGCLPPAPWSVAESDIQGRRDFRGLRVCSIDPPGCKDIDDALHARKLENGNVEIGIHIADVTNFVKPGSPIDEEAQERGTTVYLVDRRIDMLPSLLTTDICSLRGGVERLAFSAIFEMNLETAEVVNVTFSKSVIKSVLAMTYGEAQNRIDDKSLNDPLTKDIRLLNQVAKKLRAKRMAAGALTLASPEVKFQLDSETHDPTDVAMYQMLETNALVEEYMLLANIYTGKKINEAFPQCAVLRRHPTPPPKNFEPVLEICTAYGITLDLTSSKTLADTLDAANDPSDPYFNNLIRIAAARCMTQAIYFSSGDVEEKDYWHYGLATPIYTHFTSPIRRYADVLVHRLLAAACHITPLDQRLHDQMRIRRVTDVINRRNRLARMASRASVELHTLVYFKNRTVEEDGRVLKLRNNGVIVFVPRYGIEASVYLCEKGEKGVYDPKAQTLAIKGMNLKVFQQVRVRIEVQDSVDPGADGDEDARQGKLVVTILSTDVKPKDLRGATVEPSPAIQDLIEKQGAKGQDGGCEADKADNSPMEVDAAEGDCESGANG